MRITMSRMALASSTTPLDYAGPMQRTERRWSKAAILSFVAGIACGPVTVAVCSALPLDERAAIVCMILIPVLICTGGVLAVLRVGRSRGRLRGGWFAAFGAALPIPATFVTILLFASLL